LGRFGIADSGAAQRRRQPLGNITRKPSIWPCGPSQLKTVDKKGVLSDNRQNGVSGKVDSLSRPPSCKPFHKGTALPAKNSLASHTRFTLGRCVALRQVRASLSRGICARPKQMVRSHPTSAESPQNLPPLQRWYNHRRMVLSRPRKRGVEGPSPFRRQVPSCPVYFSPWRFPTPTQ
jgi:hypothetical protein